MQQKVCLVTGGSSGVGKATARGLARAGAAVILVSRDRERAEHAARGMREETGNPRIEVLSADLSSLQSVRALAEEFRQRFAQLHVLSLNAATVTMDRRLTPEGHETILATNYLGHFLLTHLLLDALRAGAPSRVIAVSGHPRDIVRTRPRLDDLELERGFSPLRATAQAAVAKVLFTLELARRLEGTRVTANTFHPGLVRSGLPRHLPWYLKAPASLLMRFLREECDTSVFLALAPEVEGISGQFFIGRKPAPFRPAYDLREAGERLWAESVRLTGI
jgi:NAD(P)-dependent dehydrogenase (short-subunit alcohol dehydrogenase family)